MLANIAAISGLAAMASAHVVMVNPVPYGQSSLNNSPLDASGSDFPCKQRPSVYSADGASNIYPQGSTQHLAFRGTAVHGGGSCQVSITTDLKPTKNSVWKVIKSIEGGCPAKGQTGNMGSDAAAPVPYKYDFQIPKELVAGNYTMAWTWFNKVGNREMYMNCAPMTVTGDSGSDSFMKTLPDMFVANISPGANACRTKPNIDVKFPNPGVAIARFGDVTAAYGPPVGACGTGPNEEQKIPTGVDAPSKELAPSKPAITSPPFPLKRPDSLPGGVFITIADPQQSGTMPANSENATMPATATSPTGTTPTPEATPESGDTFKAGTPCKDEGKWNCIDGRSFQRCASGQWSVVQALAAGVQCKKGVSDDFQMSAIPNRRAIRRSGTGSGRFRL